MSRQQHCGRGVASAEATRGLSDRPLEPFGYSAFIVKVNV